MVCSMPAVWAWGAENAVPTAASAERYAHMAEHSPFALASAVASAAAPQASFAANWYVGGIGRLGDTDFVTIKARDLSTQFSLYGREPNAQNGVTLASVHWSETVGKSTVVLQKGAETAKLEFNEAELRGPPQATVAAGVPPGGRPPLPVAPLPVSTGPMPIARTSALPQHALKTLQPPTNLPANLPGAAPAPAGVQYPFPNRAMSPGAPELRRRAAPNPVSR